LPAQVTIDTVAGGGSLAGLNAAQSLAAPFTASAAGPDGSIYFIRESAVYRIGPEGVVHAFAGTGVSGFSGDGGPAIASQLWSPAAVAIDSHGTVFIADLYRIRAVTADGTIRTVAGDGYPATSVTDGGALTTPAYPVGIAIDPGGNLYFTEPFNARVRKLNANGTVSLLAGAATGCCQGDGDGGPATLAHLYSPGFIAIDAAGNPIFQDGNVIRQVTPDGIIHTVAGSAVALPKGPIADGSKASAVSFSAITGLAVAASGTIYIGGTDSEPKTGVWRVTTDGLFYSVASPAGKLIGIDGASNLYLQGTTGSRAIYQVNPGGSSVVLAGSGSYSSPDGAAAKGAVLALDTGSLAVDSSDRVLFPDLVTCRVRAIAGDGTLITVAGTGHCASSAAAGPALTTDLCYISGIAASSSGSLFVGCSDGTAVQVDASGTAHKITTGASSGCRQVAADSRNTLYCLQITSIIQVTNSGTATTISTNFQVPDAISVAADDTLYAFLPPGTSAFNLYKLSGASLVPIANGQSFLFTANSLVTDRLGNVYLADGTAIARHTGARESKIGLPLGYSGDGGPAQSAMIASPYGLAQDSKGNIYFVDYEVQRIRRLSGALPSSAPTISGIANSASFGGAPFSPGELISIFGASLAPATAVAVPNDVLIEPVLGNTRVLVDSVPVPVLAVSPGQVNAVLDAAPGSSVQVVVEVDGVSSLPMTVPVVSSAPGIFTANGSGSGTGSIVNQDGTINSASHPAPAGSVIAVYATGGGALQPAVYSGYLDVAAPYGSLGGSVSVTIGGKPAAVLYAGGAPFLIEGVDQFNVTIPSGLASGAADLIITVGGQASNKVSVQVQ
jgi:uncharacterized protein (TIGR03437 family)